MSKPALFARTLAGLGSVFGLVLVGHGVAWAQVQRCTFTLDQPQLPQCQSKPPLLAPKAPEIVVAPEKSVASPQAMTPVQKDIAAPAPGLQTKASAGPATLPAVAEQSVPTPVPSPMSARQMQPSAPVTPSVTLPPSAPPSPSAGATSEGSTVVSAVSPLPITTLAAPAQQWDIRLQDVTLHGVLQRWAQRAGYRLLWDFDKHLLIDSPDVYEGSFESALSAVLSTPAIALGAAPLEVCFYPNKPPLARITRRGEQARECQ